MQSDEASIKKVVKYARWGEWASTAGIALFLLLLAFAVGALSLGIPFPFDEFLDDLDLGDIADTLTVPQTVLGAAFLSLEEFLGLAMLVTARQLFIGFRTTGVFTTQSVAYLRRIGLIILALAPVSIVSQTIANFILTLWITGDRISISLGFDDTDVYAIVIGLVITAVSQVMLEAVRISDENRAFV